MEYFTSDDFNPSENTLNIIRQIAYAYNTMKFHGSGVAYCVN